MRTTVNDKLFEVITHQLDEAFRLPALPTKLFSQLEEFAYEFCQRAIFELYNYHFHYVEQLLDASLALGMCIRKFCEHYPDDNYEELAEMFSTTSDFVEAFPIWEARWEGRNQPTTIPEQTKLLILSTAKINDETSLKDLITVVMAVVLYGGRIEFQIKN